MVGTAMLVMWNDVLPDLESEYRLWHTAVHVPERLANPGFRSARRYWNPDAASERYFTMYELDGLEALASPTYRTLLDNPTADTERIMPAFRNFTRGACDVAYSRATGVGGTVATWRFDCPDGDARLADDLRSLATQLPDTPAIVGVHAGVSTAASSATKTAEGRLRARVAVDKTFTAVILAECLTSADAQALDGQVGARIGSWSRGVSNVHFGTYQLSGWLDAPGK
jgi:hypothetical protein